MLKAATKFSSYFSYVPLISIVTALTLIFFLLTKKEHPVSSNNFERVKKEGRTIQAYFLHLINIEDSGELIVGRVLGLGCYLGL